MFVEFRLSSGRQETLAIVDMSTVPMPGEWITIEEHDYKIRARGWRITREGKAVAWVTLLPVELA